MNNEGELLIQGAQTDFTKPIFLSSKKSIVLHSVEANVLKLTSPSVVGVGKSYIDFLALEGLMSDEGEEVAATYINTGSLTAKEVFLKNLTSTNTGTLTTDGFEAEGGAFRNAGTLEMTAKTYLGMRTFINSGTVIADSIDGSATLTSFENTHGGKVIIEEDFRPGESTTVINDGTIEGAHYQLTGPSFIQNGTLTGKSLNVGKDTTFATGAHQELTLSEHLDSASTTRWKLTGTVNVHEFNHLGAIDLEGALNTTTFTGHGTVQPTGTFTSERSHFTDAFTNLGQVSAHVLDADAALTTNGLMRVSNAAKIRGKFKVGAKGRFIGIEDQSLSLTCHDTANIAGKVDVDSLITAKAISVKGRGQLITRQSTTLTDQLTIQPKSVVQFKGLKANGAFIDNHGTLTVEGIETGAAGLTLTNAGTAHIDAEQVLPRASEDDPENTARIAAILPIDAEFIVRGEEARSEAIEDRALLAYQQIQRIPINPIITQWNASIFYSMLADQNSYEAQEIIVCGIGGKKSLSIQAGFAEVHRRKAAGDSVAQSLLETNICRTYDEQDALISEYNRQSHQQKQAYAAGFKREDYANFEEFEAALKKRNWESCLLLKPTEIVGGALRDATIDSVLSGFAELQRRNDAGDLVAKSLLSKRVPKSLKDKLQFIEQYNNDLRMQQLAYAVGESYINLTDLEATLKEKNRVKYAASEVQEIVVCGIGGEKSLSIQAGIAELHRRKDAGDLIAKSLLEKMPCKTYRNMEKIIDEYNAQIRMQRQAYAEYLKEVEQRPETTEIEFLRNGSERQAIIDGLIELQRRNDAGDLVAKSILSKGLIGNLFDRVLLIENYNNDLKMQRILKAADCKTMRFHDLATACLETISTLPSHEREALLTAMQERVNLVDPTYLGRFGFSDSTGPSAFTELRTNVVAQIQTDADITMQQLQDIADCKAFMPAVRPIKLKLTNQATGQVTLKSGRFDFVEDTAFANDGTLVQDHACLHWITGLPGAFNTGTWAVKGSLGLVGYKAEDVGSLEVEETLHVHTTEDALKALGSMSKVKAGKIVMHAPKFTVEDDQQFDMPLELHIQDMFSLQAKLVAPAFVVKAKTLELGSSQGKWGVLSAYQNGMKICVDSFRNMFGHVTAMQDAEITVNGDEFVNGAYSQVPGYVAPAEGAFAYPYPRKRNGAAISVGGPLKISVRGQNALLNNYYGLIQSDGYLDLFSQKQLMNFAGIISSKGGGVLSAPEITVQRDAVLRKESGPRFCDGHYYPKDGCQVRDSCSGHGQCSQLYHFREQSDEGWINVGGGDLEIDTNSLSVLASHIISKNNLFLKRQGVEVPKSENGELKGAPGVLVQSHQDSAIYHGMCRNNTTYQLSAIHKAGIFSHSDMELESNGLKIEGISTTKTMDVVKALAQTIQSAGFDVTTDQARDLLIDLTSGAKSQAAEPHSLVVQKDGQFSYDVPFERGVKVGYGRGPMPVLTHSYEAFERNLRPNMFLCPTVSQMVLDQLLDNVVLKALRNPRGSDFAQIMYANAQYAAIKNMKRRLLQNKEAASEEEAGAIVVARYNQVIPITHADMSAYADDMRASAKEMLLFQLGANYRAIEKLKRMEGDLDQEVQELRPQVFIPKGVVSADKTTASVHSDGALNNRVTGDMIMRGAAEYSSHGGTTRVTGNLIAEAVAIRQGSVDNFHEEGAHPLIRNAGTNNTQHILVDGGIALTSARVDTGGAGNVMNMQAQESICEYALPLVDQQTTHSRTKRENIIRIMTRTHMDPLQQIGSGTRTLKSGVVYQQASAIAEDTTLMVEAQQHTHDEVHDQVSVQTIIQKRGKRGWFGTPGSRKTIESLARAYFSQGGKIKGALFSQCDHYKSVNTEYDSANVVINTPQAQFQAGTNSSSSQTRTIYKGAVWNKFKLETESHSTRSPCQFKQPVTVHGQKATVEQRPGSAPVSNLITTNPITYLDVADHHDSSSKSQKSLSMGAALVLKLALTLSMGNPFAASSIPSAMASAGYSTLCSEAMVCLVENDGNPGRAMHALGERNIGKSIVRSVATAGLTKGIGGLCGVTDALTIPNLARQYLIQSAITTTMSVVVDKQNIGDAMRQGATSAVVNTVAAWSAGQIGDLASEKMGAAKISSPTQTGLHFATGAAAGGISAVILGGDIGREALARGMGSAVGHKLAETFGDMGMETSTAAQLGNIGTVGLAMLTDQDVMAAYQGSCNAIEHNFSRHRLNPIENLVKSVKKGMEVKEGEAATPEQEAYERGRQIYVKDSLELARQLNGGSLSVESAERIVSNANELYATKYTTDLCGAMTGKTIVGASELIPGMRGINKAWMGVVNHMRGDLSDGQLADEILGGIHSALTDAAFCVATAGAAHYYRNAKMVVGAAKEAAKVGGAEIVIKGSRQTPGTAHVSAPLVDAQVMLRGTHGNAGNIPLDVAKMMEGKSFNSFDLFRNEFWKSMSKSKYAGEFGEANITRMEGGLAPFAVKSQHIGLQKNYHLHHKSPISHGGAVYDLSNIQIVTPRFHKEVLEKSFHAGAKK
jgi:hypothetical protein